MFEVEEIPITSTRSRTSSFLQEALAVIKQLDPSGKNSVFVPVGEYRGVYSLRSSLNTTLQRAAIKFISRTEIKFECEDHGKTINNREKPCCNKGKQVDAGLRIWRKL